MARIQCEELYFLLDYRCKSRRRIRLATTHIYYPLTEKKLEDPKARAREDNRVVITDLAYL